MSCVKIAAPCVIEIHDGSYVRTDCQKEMPAIQGDDALAWNQNCELPRARFVTGRNIVPADGKLEANEVVARTSRMANYGSAPNGFMPLHQLECHNQEARRMGAISTGCPRRFND